MALEAIQCLGELLLFKFHLHISIIKKIHVYCKFYSKAFRLTVALISINTGGNGYINDYPTGRLLRDAKLYEIGAGTSEIRRLIIGRALNKEYE